MLEIIKQKIAQANESKQTFDSYVFALEWVNGYCQVNDCGTVPDMLEPNIFTIHVESEIHGLEKRHVLQVNDIARMLNEECKQLSEMVDNI